MKTCYLWSSNQKYAQTTLSVDVDGVSSFLLSI
jgi:hypothetical protein